MKRLAFAFVSCLSLAIITGCVSQSEPITWEIVDEVKAAGGGLKELNYYLSGPVTLVPESHHLNVATNAGTLVITNEKRNFRDITMTTTDKGKLISYISDPRNMESFEILFPDKVITMKFQRNRENNRYDFVSANNAGRNYVIQPGTTPPHLNIKVAYRHGRSGMPGESSTEAPLPNREMMGAGSLQKDAVVNFILSRPSAMSRPDIEEVITTYIEEARREQINHDIAIALMCEGTNFLSKPEIARTHNYGDLQRLGNRETIFPDRRSGIRAHIQQLKAYASSEGFSEPVVDRARIDRIKTVRGKVTTFDELFPYWETKNPAQYKNTINNMLDDMYAYNRTH